MSVCITSRSLHYYGTGIFFILGFNSRIRSLRSFQEKCPVPSIQIPHVVMLCNDFQRDAPTHDCSRNKELSGTESDSESVHIVANFKLQFYMPRIAKTPVGMIDLLLFSALHYLMIINLSSVLPRTKCTSRSWQFDPVLYYFALTFFCASQFFSQRLVDLKCPLGQVGYAWRPADSGVSVRSCPSFRTPYNLVS